MRKKNRSVPFAFAIKFIIVSTLLFLWIAPTYRLTEANAFEPVKIYDLSQAAKKRDTSTVKIDQELINSILNEEAKYIEFSSSKKYDNERNIVYKITNMEESERDSEGSMKKAIIDIALEDVNNDGIKEILAYIEQFEWCGKGGGYCTFLVLKKNIKGNWEELFRILTYRDIGMLKTENYKYHYLIFRNISFRISGKEKIKDRQEITVWRWNGKQYEPYIKNETIYDIKMNKVKSIFLKWDKKSDSWNQIGGHN